MRSKKINQKMTLLTLVVALGVAVYLNWEYAKSTDLALDAAAANAQVAASTDAEPGVITDALAVDGEVATGDKNYGEAQLVSVGEATGDEFFEQARLTRTKARDEALDTLQKSLKSAKLTDEEKESLTAQLTAAIDNIATESDIENLVKAKGFVDCVAFIDGDQVDVTVMTTSDGLTKEEVAQIRDVVLSKCQVTAQDITIVEVK
ncbi:MAG TPA: SpoIIIAH-like family protein [Candidatus Fournierella merdigallinarum]|nr:SpoIIIAH-like family protein [Candidatus Fournierella merdigallinarum]